MISDGLRQLLPCDCLAVYVKSGESLLPHYLDGPCAAAFSLQPIPAARGLSGWVAHNERPIVNGNPTMEPNYVQASGLFTETSSALSIPLFDLQNHVFGVLTVYAKGHAAFSEEHLSVLLVIQPKFSQALQNVMADSNGRSGGAGPLTIPSSFDGSEGLAEPGFDPSALSGTKLA